jgi:hypothetical protein
MASLVNFIDISERNNISSTETIAELKRENTSQLIL